MTNLKYQQPCFYFPYRPYAFLLLLLLAMTMTSNNNLLQAKESLKECPGSQPSYTFSIYKKPYSFSTIYEMTSDKEPFGTAEKTTYSIRKTYDLYSPEGTPEGSAICQLASFGLFFAWATDIDLYDANGFKIGLIDGELFSPAPAEFSIYNAQEQKVGSAYLNEERTEFTILNPNDSYKILATLKQETLDSTDFWNITVYDEDTIDQRIIKYFAVFAIDFQDKLKKLPIPK